MSYLDCGTFLIDYPLLKNRLPRDFEILYVSSHCSAQHVSIFLKRVVRFPTCTFVVLNAHKLAGDHQERILSFLSHRDILSKRIRLHFIQCASTLLHVLPWVQDRMWDNRSLERISPVMDRDWFKEKL